ncbi:hypothetical protein BIW11_05633 [Tropilaelaps mercedesae]|uniref:Uncharacterized protein n=1 Tax=Tropilaelaps mercedesae TaxID=418985 RepID=A0A1V9Y1H2_9ACAR|nr:hypothetical protein BIW11_05633 [Tropilaelaps mercedesae]
MSDSSPWRKLPAVDCKSDLKNSRRNYVCRLAVQFRKSERIIFFLSAVSYRERKFVASLDRTKTNARGNDHTNSVESAHVNAEFVVCHVGAPLVPILERCRRRRRGRSERRDILSIFHVDRLMMTSRAATTTRLSLLRSSL